MKNTEECANIHLVSARTSEGATEKTEFSAGGGFYEKNGAYYVTYKENAKTGLEDAQTFLKISQTCVTMRRMGGFKTVISYEVGKITEFSYKTPFGVADMRIKTNEIVNGLSDKGGILKISYTLFADSGDIENEITLEVKLRSEKDEK